MDFLLASSIQDGWAVSRTDCRGDDDGDDEGDDGGTDFCCHLSSLFADLVGTGETDASRNIDGIYEHILQL